MRRRFAPVTLAALLCISVVGPVGASDPSETPSEAPIATPAPEPTTVASSDPAATPTEGPSPTAPATDDPAPTEVPEPSVEPTPVEFEPTPEPEPPADPPADPAPTVEPARTTDPTATPDQRPTPTVDPAAVPTDAAGRPIPDGRYIVMLRSTANTTDVLARHGQSDGVRAERRFDRVLRAFTAKLDKTQRHALLDDPEVLAIVPDEVIGLAAQTDPTGVSRVRTHRSTVADIDNVDERVDADVAIVDTGVIKTHPDLNVVGGVNCSTSDRDAWADQNGHGTHVAGTVAALDNEIGVVGVAPGARIWAVRILNADGYGLLSWYVCGLDWILAQRDPNDAARPLIEAVNMSVAKSGGDDLACGTKNKDVLHQAICRLYAGGITVVAAAANDSRSAAGYVPAAYNEVITVSALADTDGKAGGLGGNRCYSWGTYDVDDTFADFSNYGSDVDVIAPGKCIWSTVPGPGYAYSSGTSMAAPAVTGAVALYKAGRPTATPKEVREALRYLGNLGWKTSTDPDPYHEPLLDVARIAALGSFSVAAYAKPYTVSDGGTLNLPVTISRTSTFFERVRLTVEGVPAGWTASLAATSLYGWDAKSTSLRLTIPVDAKSGTYTFKVVGRNWGRTRSATITVEVAGRAPFTDLDGYEGSIDWLYREGITGGCTPTRFCPHDTVTRIQMAMFLTRALHLTTTSTDYFDDDDGMTGESSVNALRRAGLTGGCGPRRYCPTAAVTRLQMAMFLTRVLDLPLTTTDYFDDDDGMTGESSVNALRLAGLTAGCGPRRFCPSTRLTREQMAALLFRSLAD